MAKPAANVAVNKTVFRTKGEAEKFAIEQRAKKKQAGYNTRYEIDRIPDGSGFVVREFVYLTNEKGELI